jgi:hypothetical protein
MYLLMIIIFIHDGSIFHHYLHYVCYVAEGIDSMVRGNINLCCCQVWHCNPIFVIHLSPTAADGLL